MIKNIAAITASSYIGMFFLGVAASLIGAAARNIGLNPFQIGLMITAQNIGFMLAVIVSGSLADTYAKSRILFIGSLVLAISFFFFYITNYFVLNLIIMILIGIGIGTYEGVTDAMLLEIHPRRENLHINVNHFFVTFGSIVITLYLIFLQMEWRVAITQSAIVVLILAIVYSQINLVKKKSTVETFQQRLRVLSREKVIVVLFIATIIVVGCEAATIGILTTFLMDLRGFDQISSKIGLIIFLLGMASGRLLVGIFTPRGKIPLLILALFGFSVLIFGSLYFLDLGTITSGAIFLAGLSMSALLPLMLTLAGLLFKEISGTVLGIIKVAIPIGGILIPFLLSLFSKFGSFHGSLLLIPLSLLIAFLTLFFVLRSINELEPEQIRNSNSVLEE